MSLVHTSNEFGNLFLEEGSELLVLDTWNVIDESVVNTMNKVYEIGKEQYVKYHKDVVNDCNFFFLFLTALTQN